MWFSGNNNNNPTADRLTRKLLPSEAGADMAVDSKGSRKEWWEAVSCGTTGRYQVETVGNHLRNTDSLECLPMLRVYDRFMGWFRKTNNFKVTCALSIFYTILPL